MVANGQAPERNPFDAVLQRVEDVARLLELAQTTPAAMWRLAADDMQRNVPQEARKYTRYLSFAEVEDAETRRLMMQTVNGHLHLITRGSTIEPCIPVLGSEGRLLRINVLRYGWPIELWERLADVSPYEFLPVLGRNYREHAPWIKEAGAAYEYLGVYSRLPVVNGQWFMNQGAINFNRPMGYYAWLGIKNETDADRVGGFDRTKRRRKIELREAVSLKQSGVSHNHRAVARFDADEGGYMWYTLDFSEALTTATGVSALSTFGNDIEAYFRSLPNDKVKINGIAKAQLAATEKLFLNAVNFPGSFLGDAAENAQDSAPDFVGYNSTTTSRDGKIHVNLSCIACHANAMKQDFDGKTPWVRSVFRLHDDGVAFPLLTNKSYEEAERLRAQYIARELRPYIQRDRDLFDRACKEATGLPAARWQKLYVGMFESYENADVNLAWASSFLRTTPTRFKAAVYDAMKRKDYYGNTVSLALPELAGIASNNSVGVRDWEKIYPAAQILLRSAP